MNEPNANTEVEKLDLSSLDVAELKRQELVELFPEVRTEGGKIDFERLKAVLGEMVDAGRERYGMNWPGKAECMRTIQAPSMGTLLPMPEESVDWDTTENVIIEGDNLEVLKLLQKSYLGKIKMIYIDPPYNTGNDFIYPDNYTESLQTYLEFTGQVDSDGRKFGPNTDSDGRFHSRWLNMLFPRIFLARNLLRDDGIVCISIDDGELYNLVHLCNEVFGSENYLATIVLKNKAGAGAKPKGFIEVHEYIVCFAKRRELISGISLPMSAEQQKLYNKRDEHFDTRGPYGTWALGTTSMGDRPNLRFPIVHDGEEIWPEKQWLWSKERVAEAQRNNELVFNKMRDGRWSVRFKRYLKDDSGTQNTSTPTTVWDGPYTHQGTRDCDELFGSRVFSFPKPVALIRKLLDLTFNGGLSEEEDIILDFFAGSGTTGQAVLEANIADSHRRKFVLVQLPEPLDPESADARNAIRLCDELGFPHNLSELTKERLRRVVSKLSAKAELTLDPGATLDHLGFRVFRLAASNFIPWDGTASNDADQLAKQLKLGIDHTRGDRKPQDLLFEVLLKSWGEPALSLKVGEETIEGVRVFSIAEGAFLICLEEKVTLEFIRALAARKPDRVVMRESAFAGNDQLKTNAVQTFKSQGVTSFKVV